MHTGLATMAKRLTVAALVAAPAWGAAAHGLTYRECKEGGDFIRHAAMARDNGMTREAFLERLAGDLVMIRQYPPQLRWFVQDQDDETLLVQAARTVFDTPREPPLHESDFLVACAERMGGAPDSPREPPG